MFIIQTFKYLVIAIAVPLYQFVARPYFSQCIPKILTKIGLSLLFFSLLSSTAYNVLLSQALSKMNMTTIIFLCKHNNNCQIIQEVNSSSIGVCKVFVYLSSFQENISSCSDNKYHCNSTFIYSYNPDGEPFPSLNWICRLI